MRNYIKFTFSIVLLVIVIIFLANCSGEKDTTQNESSETTLSVVMVTDQAGLGDQGFNDSGWAGVQRAVKDFGITANFIESSEQADYTPNLSIAAEKADIVVAMGFLMIDSVKAVAPGYPNKKFIFIDGKVEGANIASFDFKGEEASFLAGFISGGITRSGKLGVVKGMEIPPVLAYEYGYRAGVKSANTYLNRNVQVVDMTVGDFNDPVKGKSLGRSLLSHGSDVIIQIAGNSGIGVIELFKNNNGPALLISSDIDIEDDIPGKVLTCVMKRYDNAVYSAIKSIVNDKFEPGYYNIGLQEDAVGITNMRHTKNLLNPEILEAVNKLEAVLKNGKFKVPASEKEIKLFDPSVVADFLNGKKK